MSVDISSYIGFGYKVSLDDSPYSNLDFYDEVFENWREELLDSDYTYKLDHYYDGDLFFFGIASQSVEPGEMTELSHLLISAQNDKSMDEMKKEFYHFFPNLKDRQPNVYMFSVLW